ncbi:MAG: hypothetical protein P4L34_11370 [Paludibacter sp.]|nr:hypothetical protein [Paludibacter sp.]
METILWYHYLAAFFAGMILTNAIPHLVHGLSGDKFPTPFSKPPGKGLSSPLLNTLWACFNLAIGYILFNTSKLTSNHTLLVITFFAGILATGMISLNFSKKDKE